MLKLRMSGATPLLPLYVFMNCVIISTKYNKKGLSRVGLTFLLEPPLYKRRVQKKTELLL